MTLMRIRSLLLTAPCGVAVLAGSLLGCAGSEPAGSSHDAAADFGRQDAAGDYRSAGGAPGSYDAAGTEEAGTSPPEEIVSEFYKSPVATGHYVWVANPTSGRVAYVDSRSVTVRTLDAGDRPTYLAAVPTGDVVLALNLGSNDATILNASGTSQTATVRGMPESANAWTVSADGRWAIAYTDVRRIPDLGSKNPLEGFGEIAVIDLKVTPPTVSSFSVGYRPRQVVVASDLTRGIAVTESGIAQFPLPVAEDRPMELIPVEVEPGENPSQREVLITRDGSWALARSEGSGRVVFINLLTGEATPITLSGPVSGLALNSTSDRAVAVVKSTNEVAILPVPGTVITPSSAVRMTLADARIGQVVLAESNPDIAVLFTRPQTGSLVSEITELHIAQARFRTIKLMAGVDSVLLAPDGGHAVVVHKQVSRPDGGGAATMLYGFTVVPMDDSLPLSPHQTDAPITAVAFGAAAVDGGASGPGSARALLTVHDPIRKIQGMYLARFAAGTSTRFGLASPPIQVGTVDGASKAFVVQQHSEGRITVLDFVGEQAHTVTGFELSSAISSGNGN